tara:strand:- start:1237 stop:1383 length:147 start_codon:yes stop_codon:yes gene_type:complete
MNKYIYISMLPFKFWYIGYQLDWYDGQIYSFGFGFFHFYWRDGLTKFI